MLLVSAVLAGSGPARRAARVDPLIAQGGIASSQSGLGCSFRMVLSFLAGPGG